MTGIVLWVILRPTKKPPEMTRAEFEHRCEKLNQQFEERIKNLNNVWERRPFVPTTTSHVPMRDYLDGWYEKLSYEIEDKYKENGELLEKWFEEMGKLTDDRRLLSDILYHYDMIAESIENEYYS